MSKIRRFRWWIVAISVLVAAIVLSQWPQSTGPADRYQRALRALDAGNLRVVRQELDWFRHNAGNESYRSLLVGVLLLKDGDDAAALEELQHAVNDEATRVDAWTNAAEAYYRLGRFTDAVATARSALEYDPQKHAARRWLAVAYYDLGATAYATDELGILSREVPTDARPDRLLGLIGKDTEQFPDAIKHYRESLRRDSRPGDLHEILTELAECQLKMQDHAGSLETLASVPVTAETLVLQAEAHEGLGRHAQALEAVDRALKLDPEHVPALIYKATLLMTEGQSQAAVPILEHALRIHPHDGTARFKLSQAYSQVGDVEHAAEQTRLMEESRKLEREFVDLHGQVAADTKSAELRYQLGMLARKLHKPDLARMWLRAAVALDPNHTAARKALAE
jgi:tetratricopeptide (TPR) repeat protein